MFPQSPAWEGCTVLYNKGSVLVGQMTQGHRFIRNKSKGLKSKQGRLYSQTVNPKACFLTSLVSLLCSFLYDGRLEAWVCSGLEVMGP